MMGAAFTFYQYHLSAMNITTAKNLNLPPPLLDNYEWSISMTMQLSPLV